jgi:hypothetical protein
LKTIENKTTRPLRVPLPGGKVLHLGPRKTGQVADTAVEHPALRRLIESGTIEVQGVGNNESGAGDAEGGGGGHGESRHGLGKAKMIRRGGQRGA